ncbi:MAG TPA: hypothetical protein VHS33_02445 [Sphingomicrobium sp.]|jgi:hypothetical protein|nr:hypothetical protein [Sphingomicrobium sp.]
MSWIATALTAYQLHWRRLLIPSIGVLCALALLVGAALETSRGFALRDVPSGAFALMMALYFGRAVLRELARRKTAD